MSLLSLITELLEPQSVGSPQASMYAAVLPSEAAYETLGAILGDAGVHMDSEWDAHITVIYSRRCEHYDPNQTIPHKNFDVELREFSTFPVTDDETGDTRELCILLVDSPALQSIHSSIMDEINGTYDFDEYRPHITIGFLDQLGTDLDTLNGVLGQVPAESRNVIYGDMYQEEIEE